MGNFLAALGRLVGANKAAQRIIMIGLDNAGKTTILYKLKLGEYMHTIPTIGFNVETVQYKNLNFTIWDIGGQEKIRALWKHYYQDAGAVIFVLDSSDTQRLDEASEELHLMLKEQELVEAPLLIFANKQDLPQAQSVNDIIAKMNLRDERRRRWHVQPCVATSGNGLFEGLDWLSKTLHP